MPDIRPPGKMRQIRGAAPTRLLALIWARLNRVGLSRRAACLVAGLKPDCIRVMERGHPPRMSVLEALAPVLGIPVSELVEAADDLRFDRAEFPLPEPMLPGELAQPDLEPITKRQQEPAETLLVRPLAGHGRLGSVPTPQPLAATLPFPGWLIRDEFSADDAASRDAADFVWARIAGGTSAATLEDGDLVLIDCRERQPYRAGLFAADAGRGAAAMRLEPVRGADPPRYRVFLGSGRQARDEIAADRIRILGRIVWFARRLGAAASASRKPGRSARMPR